MFDAKKIHVHVVICAENIIFAFLLRKIRFFCKPGAGFHPPI